ncbi:DUF5717 family protein [Herbinix luporum]|uniref:DUF5717 family protein n=1 Tax=Herbinix luporum TaxID=1679721 RepID=UPI0023F37B60|nr:DUF5717 family protein [Herbinix luporum]
MKEKIEQIARGEFDYDLPFLRLSVDRININVEADKKYEGSFIISNSANRSMKGVLYSSSPLISFTRQTFSGKENTITYLFDASFLNPSYKVSGNITIVSDCGEMNLPFTAHIETRTINTSIGKIKNLFEFTNLARLDWAEAIKVFASDEFERIILKNEEKYHVIYRNLLKSNSTGQALEEFLISVNKKSRINLSIDRTALEYEIHGEDVSDKLVLTKNQWGSTEIRISTDVPFIQLDKNQLLTDDFIGNTHELKFKINAATLHGGNNYGSIWIKTIYQTIKVDLICKKHKENTGNNTENKNLKKIKYEYTKNYLDYRLGRINLTKYSRDTKLLLSKLKNSKDSIFVKLVNLHLAILTENNPLASQLLEELSKQEAEIKSASSLEYCAYLYLLRLYRKDENNSPYERNRNYILKDIKKRFEAGSFSPLLYQEALCVYMEEPYLLRELGDFEIQVLNYGIKYKYVSKELALQYTYLAGRLKFYHPLVFKGLVSLYNTYKKDEILSSICSLLIKGYKTDNKYFQWYSRGVNAQLRITQLYEYYMYSVDESRMDPLPQPLLIYFVYNSRLNDKKMAYLYANIIKNKKANDHIYHLYYKSMEVFAQKQLEAKNISPNLSIIYREFIYKKELNQYFNKYLPDVMFTQELYCDNPNIVSVAVAHKELDEEVIVPLTEGRAYIMLYTREANIFLLDSFGNRYVTSIKYTLKPLLSPREFKVKYMDYEKHPKLLLYLFDHYRTNRVVSEKSIALRKQVLLMPSLKESYYVDCLLTLIEYYYENYNGDLLEHYLLKLDLAKVNVALRKKYLEYMIIRGYYDKALHALSYVTIESIPIKMLLKLCSGWINNSGYDIKEDLLVFLCHYIFTQGKYDKKILNYLVKYYNGSTMDMIKLWRGSKNFEIDTYELEERVLAQALFSENTLKEIFGVFLEYYPKAKNHLLVRSFLTYYSYKYLVHDLEIHKEIFSIIRREQNYEENNISLLAWLKYSSNNTEFTEDDMTFISYNIDRFERQGLILPFFKKYKNVIKLSCKITDRFYVEYRANPNSQVFIHYRLLTDNAKDKYITERMSHMLMGICVKDFILFYNEELEYYITEETEDEIHKSETFRLRYEDDGQIEDSKYNRINMMLNALENHRDTELLDMMADYIETEYIIRECFEPLP